MIFECPWHTFDWNVGREAACGSCRRFSLVSTPTIPEVFW